MDLDSPPNVPWAFQAAFLAFLDAIDAFWAFLHTSGERTLLAPVPALPAFLATAER